jgi:hypothetical protein
VTQDAVGREGRQVEERAGREIHRAPARAASIGEGVRQVFRGARADGRAESHRAPPLELEPEGVDAAVVVQAHALSSAALHDEQEGALLAERAEKAGADGHHQPGDAREHLVRLGQVRGGAHVERGAQAPPVARPVVAAIGHEVKRQARPGEGERACKVWCEAAPLNILRWKNNWFTAESPAEAGERRPIG